MQGTNFLIIVGGVEQPVDGTSASTPSFAALVSLLNDALLAAGQPQLGFLNPLIYQAGSRGFNDITTGSNPGCGTDGFPALAGWDPATGVGTPDFEKLLALAMADPTRTPPQTSTATPSASSTAAAPPATSTDAASQEISGLIDVLLKILQSLTKV